VEAKDLLIAIHGASSTLPVAATVNVDEGMTWTDHFADFVDPRPRELLNGSIRDVDSAEALSELWRDADGESWYE
jgi:hypothetical protein